MLMTHGANSYDFNLTAILVVDEFGEGYPTAWCISNRTDLIAWCTILKLYKEK